MYQGLPFTDRRQRRDAGMHRRVNHGVLVGEKDHFDPANVADQQELLTVRDYGRR